MAVPTSPVFTRQISRRGLGMISGAERTLSINILVEIVSDPFFACVVVRSWWAPGGLATVWLPGMRELPSTPAKWHRHWWFPGGAGIGACIRR